MRVTTSFLFPGKEGVMFGWISPKSHIPIPSSSSYAHDSLFSLLFYAYYICLPNQFLSSSFISSDVDQTFSRDKTFDEIVFSP